MQAINPLGRDKCPTTSMALRNGWLACMLLLPSLVLAHPEFIDEIREQRLVEDARTLQGNGEQGRFLIQGTFFIGSPVHEELSARSITLSGIRGRPFDVNRDKTFIRGVFWNDDPLMQLWPDKKVADVGSWRGTWGVDWYRSFRKAEKRATPDRDGNAHFHSNGDSLLARSHFGDMQFLHAMADRDGVPASETREKIIMWMEFSYRVARGEISGSTRLDRVPVAGIPQLFAGDASLQNATVADLFRTDQVRAAAAGSMLHIIQDSFADGHVERENLDLKIDGRSIFNRGAINSFRSYVNQDHGLHSDADELPENLDLDLRTYRGQRDPIAYGAGLLKLAFTKAGARDGKGNNWPIAKRYLLEKVFPLTDGQILSGPGDAYDTRQHGRDIAVADSVTAPRRLALLVGVDKYRAAADIKGFSNLDGAVNDVLAMKALLKTQYGFAEEGIVMLLDEEATHENILASFRDHLIDQARNSDDIVLFQFSGHGSQMPSSDPGEGDVLDETIVPHDSRQGGVFDITDKKIAGLFDQVRTDNAIYILDSCHSGDANRSSLQAKARFIPPDTRVPPPVPAGLSSRSADTSTVEPRYVFISGSEASELSYELRDDTGAYHGALSYFLVSELAGLDHPATYQEVMEQVSARVSKHNRGQHPQIVGTNMDNFVFQLNGEKPGAYLGARAYLGTDPAYQGMVFLDGGSVHNVTKQSVFDLYPPGTRRFDGSVAPIAHMTVDAVRAYAAMGRIKPVTLGSVVSGVMRAVEREHHFREPLLRVHVGGADQSKLLATIEFKLRGQRGIQLVRENEYPQVVIKQVGDQLRVSDSGDRRRAPLIPVTDHDVVMHVSDQMKHWLKWYGVLGISNDTDQIKIAVDFDHHTPRDSGQVANRFSNCDKFKIVMINNSERELYFTLISLPEDGDVDILYPRKGRGSQSVTPGNSIATDELIAEHRLDGQESFEHIKLIATDESIDLWSLEMEAARGQVKGGARGGVNSLQSQLRNIMDEDKATRTVHGTTPVDNWQSLQKTMVIERSKQACDLGDSEQEWPL